MAKELMEWEVYEREHQSKSITAPELFADPEMLNSLIKGMFVMILFEAIFSYLSEADIAEHKHEMAEQIFAECIEAGVEF